MILHRSGGDMKDSCYLLDGKFFKIMEADAGPFPLRKPLQGLIELLIAKLPIGRLRIADVDCLRVVKGDFVGHRSSDAVDEAVIADAEEPGPELRKAQERPRRHIGPKQRLLGQVVGLCRVAATQYKQESPERLLLLTYKRYELLPSHGTTLSLRRSNFQIRSPLQTSSFQ